MCRSTPAAEGDSPRAGTAAETGRHSCFRKGSLEEAQGDSVGLDEAETETGNMVEDEEVRQVEVDGWPGLGWALLGLMEPVMAVVMAAVVVVRCRHLEERE